MELQVFKWSIIHGGMNHSCENNANCQWMGSIQQLVAISQLFLITKTITSYLWFSYLLRFVFFICFWRWMDFNKGDSISLVLWNCENQNNSFYTGIINNGGENRERNNKSIPIERTHPHRKNFEKWLQVMITK